MAVKVGSKTHKILQRLESGKSISSLNAFELYKVTRLASIIFNLREIHGYVIVITHKTSPTGIRYAEYHLIKD